MNRALIYLIGSILLAAGITTLLMRGETIRQVVPLDSNASSRQAVLPTAIVRHRHSCCIAQPAIGPSSKQSWLITKRSLVDKFSCNTDPRKLCCHR